MSPDQLATAGQLCLGGSLLVIGFLAGAAWVLRRTRDHIDALHVAFARDFHKLKVEHSLMAQEVGLQRVMIETQVRDRDFIRDLVMRG